MNAKARSLILKADEHFELSKKQLHDASQRSSAGFNLAKSAELFIKALCELRQVTYDVHENDLDILIETLEEARFAKISAFGDLVDLTPYNSPGESAEQGDVDLAELVPLVDDLKLLVGQEVKLDS